MSRSAWLRVLGVLLAVAVTVAVLVQVGRDWGTVTREARHLLRLDPPFLAAAWLVQSAGWLLVVDTWARILRRMGGQAPFLQHLRVHTLSGLANVLPGSVWLPVTRVTGYRGTTADTMAVGTAMAVEWLLLGVAGLVLYGLVAPFSQLPQVVSLVSLLVAGGLAAAALHPAVFARLVGAVATRLGYAGPAPRPGVLELAGWFGRELGVLVLAGLGLYLVMRGVSPVASLPVALGVTGLTLALANLLAWLPASAVLKDASMVVLLTPLYGTAGMALAVVVVWRLWLTLVQVSWAALAAVAERVAVWPRWRNAWR